MNSSDQATLGQFIKHTPRILRRQLILQLVEQYCATGKAPGASGVPVYQGCLPCKPSIQRFHAALLFVDISGFTALSLRLNVEELKNHINEYFTKMLGIVDKHGGDVIKFAGDALFIIWETDQTSALQEDSHAVHLDVAKQKALRKAVECGREINAACGNHKITIPGQSISVTRVIRSMFGNGGADKKAAPAVLDPIDATAAGGGGGGGSSEEASVAYLNVHSGVSWGLMAGIDIGADNRWEYFLIGEPLSKVAEAESQASTGDMIICPESHTILHGREEPVPFMKRFGSAFSSRFNLLGGGGGGTSKPAVSTPPSAEHSGSNSTSQKAMKCGCVLLKGGYCKMDMSLPAGEKNAAVRKSRTKKGAAAIQSEQSSSAFAFASEVLVDTLKSDIDDAFLTFRGLFQERIDRLAKPRTSKPTPLITNGNHAATADTAAAGLSLTPPELTPSESVQETFRAWALTCLSDEIARHVHAAVRHEYVFDAPKRSSMIQESGVKGLAGLQQQQQLPHPQTPKSVNSLHNESPSNSQHNSVSAHSTSLSMSMHGNSSPTREATGGGGASRNITLSPISAGGGNRRESHLMSKQHTDKVGGAEKAVREASGLTTEIRNVTVMFVKIDLADMNLMIDETKRRKVGGGYRFLPKTVNEKFADLMLLDRLQSCMEALQQSFSSHGGQMRQFIVDDKGTVCIGTFGLRGSMSDDNAAAALDTAQMIINKLKVVGLNCSIGVTVGRAYCGLVGSGHRHEYAVMGPSTNLSARLMCKAPPGGVICDIETRTRDRTHQFVTLADIVAKGYKLPVGTFKPVFESEQQALAATSPLAAAGALLREKSEMVFNTDAEAVVSVEDSSKAVASEATNEVIQRILQSKFVVERNMGNRVVKVELHGRRPLLRQALTFAFQNCVVELLMSTTGGGGAGGGGSSPGNKSPKAGGNRSPTAAAAAAAGPASPTAASAAASAAATVQPKQSIFNHELPAKFIGIVGAQGIGKTSFVLSITQRIYAVAASNAALYNIQLFKSRVIAAGAQPFHAWKPIITEMLIRIHRFNLPAVQQTAHMGRRRSLVAGVSAAGGGSDIKAGIAYAVGMFPKHLQKYAALFTFIGIVEPENNNTNTTNNSGSNPQQQGVDALKLTEYEKIMHSTQLLLSVIQLYLRVTKNLVFITLEDIHLFDQHSLALLYEVYHSVNGVIVLFTGRLQTTTVHMDCSDASNLLNGFTSLLDDNKKYLEVQLESLSKSATHRMVKDIFTVHNVSDVQESVYSTVYDVSRGNPFYVYEIANSMAESKDRNVKAVNAVHCIRIEEVICYRFDQLNNTAQTLLKIAAVAFSNGSSFSLELLASIAFDAEAATTTATASQGRLMTQAMSARNVATILLDIISSESFIRVIKKEGAAEVVDLSILTVELLLSGEYLFEFSISLEQSTLYGLLLDDQKQVIHERVAEYYAGLRESSVVSESQLASHTLAEEGFHWHRASFPSSAMMCYYRAAETEEQQGGGDDVKRAEYLAMAYSMFTLLREDAGVVVPHKRAELRLADVRQAFDSSFAGVGETQQQVRGSPVVVGHPVLQLEQVHEIFDGSTQMLRVGMLIHIRLAQSSLALQEDPAGAVLMLEDALQMVLLVRNPVLMDSSYLDAMMQTMHGADSRLPKNWSNSLRRSDDNEPPASRSDSPVKLLVDEVHFFLQDFSDYFFPVLSASLQNYLQLLATSSEAQAKAAFLSEKFLELARAEVQQQQQQQQQHHLIQALIQSVLLLTNAGSLRRAAALFEELLSLYQAEAHSSMLVAAYGSDQMPLACAVVALHSLSSSSISSSSTSGGNAEPSKAEMLASKALELLSSSTHLPSLGACLFAVVSAAAFVGRHSDAACLLVRYDSLMKQRLAVNSASSYFTQKAVDLMSEWSSTRARLAAAISLASASASDKGVQHEETKESSDKRNNITITTTSISSSSEIDQVLLSCGLVLPPEVSPTGFGTLNRFGLDVRCVLADLSILRCCEQLVGISSSSSINKNNSSSGSSSSLIVKYCEGVCVYGAAVLSQVSYAQSHEVLLSKHRVSAGLMDLLSVLQRDSDGGAASSSKKGNRSSKVGVIDKVWAQLRTVYPRGLLDTVKEEARKCEAVHTAQVVQLLADKLHGTAATAAVQ